MDEADCSFCRQSHSIRNLVDVGVQDGPCHRFCARCLAGASRVLGLSAETCEGCRSVQATLDDVASAGGVRSVREVVLADLGHNEGCPFALLLMTA